MMISPPLNLYCGEVTGLVGEGVTDSLRAAAMDQDENDYRIVLKLREATRPGRGTYYGATSLACELISAILARAVGLRVPDYAVVDVTPDVLSSVKDPDVQVHLAANLGPNFGSVQLRGFGNWDPTCRRISENLRASLEEVVTFDASVMNADRQSVNPNLLWDGLDDVRVIDHGLATVPWVENGRAAKRPCLLPGNLVQGHCGFQYLHGTARTFGGVLATWGALMTPEAWAALRSYIPSAWEHRAGVVDDVIAFLMQRPADFNALRTDLKRIVR